jgi:hypothetical protein
MTTLLLSARQTPDNQALWRAAVQAGWDVERVQGVRVPEHLEDSEIVLYVEALFAPIIAARLRLTLIEPEADWLARLPHAYRRRDIRLATLLEARELQGPTFVKPPNDKSFEAKVYRSGGEIPGEFDDDMTVLIAEPVEFEVEYRCFVLDRTLRTMSPYLRQGRLTAMDDYSAPQEEAGEARSFAERMLADSAVDLPRAVAIDVGRIKEKGWAVVEANGAWGSGIYGCDPVEVLEVIRHAVTPLGERG